MQKFAYKIFHHGGDVMLAISDADIVGKTLRSRGLEITVSREFYCEKSCGGRDVQKLAEGATIINAIGKEIVALLSSKGFLSVENIIMVGEVPHAQIISL